MSANFDMTGFERLRNEIIENAISGAVLVAANNTHARWDNRIFEAGRDSNGNKIGSYSTNYAKLRTKKGRQTSFIDMNQTGSLRGACNLVKINDREYQIKITDKDEVIKMRGNEQRKGIKVGALTDSEKQKFNADIISELKEILR
jgi:hypothetical protein